MIDLRTLVIGLPAALLSASFFMPAAQADLIWGANGHPFTAYPGLTIESQLDYLKEPGMRSYRVNRTDSSQTPRLALLIQEGRKRGIDILPVITPAGVNLERTAPKTCTMRRCASRLFSFPRSRTTFAYGS